MDYENNLKMRKVAAVKIVDNRGFPDESVVPFCLRNILLSSSKNLFYRGFFSTQRRGEAELRRGLRVFSA